MAELRNLNELAKQVVQNFNEKFDARDCKIPREFKDSVKRLKTFSVVYNEYSVIIKGDGVRSKDSYVPNQSFFMASFFIEYSHELSKYKQKIMPWLSKAGISNSELTAFFTHERDKGKVDIENGIDKFVEILDKTGYSASDRDYLIRFVTDYDWWSGSKTIERSDFFNSPVLSIMGLSASSNAAMALIVDHLTQHPELSGLLLNQIEMANMTNKDMGNFQQIFYGAPGTGKSHKIKNDERVKVADEKNLVFRTTFHPDSDYSTFVGAYKPTKTKRAVRNVAGDIVKDTEKKDVFEDCITYSFVPQAFLQAYVAAWNHQDENVFLVIEEINRGNCAQIFGDLFQLLDRDDEGYSEYPIKADIDLVRYLEDGKDEDGQDVLINKDGIKDRKLKLPKNLYIWATMNTSDQSLFPIDSAFKRRWEWVYQPIDTAKETWYVKVGEDYYSWTAFLNKVNDELLTDETAEDKHLGFYFCKATEKREGTEATPNVITAETFVGKVLFYLWNDVFKVYGIPSSIGSSKDWPYRKFYQTNGEVDNEKVAKLMAQLKIDADAQMEPQTEEE
ncbi:MAG: AAA family ATPase [Bacteroidaceae bacterium]|nr:AAA family ATPase [Bacteroidaceae bacterium]